MTQDNYTDADDAQDESIEGESPVIKALRKRAEAAEKQLKSAPDRATIEAELRAQLARERAIEAELTHFGHPAGISATVAAQLGDGEVTRESVAGALQTIGYKVASESDGGSGGGDSSSEESDLAKTVSLSGQVAAAATNQPSDDAMDKIQQAKTPGELAAVMAGIEGATRDYTGR